MVFLIGLERSGDKIAVWLVFFIGQNEVLSLIDHLDAQIPVAVERNLHIAASVFDRKDAVGSRASFNLALNFSVGRSKSDSLNELRSLLSRCRRGLPGRG